MAMHNAPAASTATESSTLISLSELMHLEKKRIDEEKRAAQRKAEQEALRLGALREQQRREQEQRAQAELQALREREQKEAERTAELAGRLLGFIVRAQKEAESRSQLAARELELAHERELTRRRSDKTLGRLRARLVATATGTVLLFTAAIAVYAAVLRPQHHRALADVQHRVQDSEAEAVTLRNAVAEARSTRDKALERSIELSRELRALRSEVETLCTSEGQPSSVGRRPPGKPPSDAPPPPTVTWAEGDPMAPLNRR